MHSSKPMSHPLSIRNLTVHYDKKPALWGVDLDIPEGQIIGIIGPNGAGKTTLLKGIMGLLPVSSGTVHVYGKPFKQNRKRVGYMPQRGEVDWDFPVTVLDVVLMGRYGHLRLFQRPRKKDIEIAWQCLAKVKLTAFANRQIGNLSGGQQQRVFLARALAQDSDLYLMDEPFAGVDAATESATMTLFREMKSRNKTLLVVHHDLASAQRYYDMLLLLNSRVIAFGPTEEIFNVELLQKTYGGRLAIFEGQRLATNPDARL